MDIDRGLKMSYADDFSAAPAYQRQRLMSWIAGETAVRRVVLVEPRLLIRACLEWALVRYLPNVEVKCAGLVDDLPAKTADLILLGINDRLAADTIGLRSLVCQSQGLGNGAPIGAYLYGEEARISLDPASLDLVGVVPSSCGLEILVAAVQLMLAGGTYLPTNGLQKDESKIDQARSLSSDCAVKAEEIAEEVLPPWALSRRERDVLAKLRDGHQNKIIAFELGISESTVKVHLRNIMKKTGATNRTQVVMRFDAAPGRDILSAQGERVRRVFS